MPSKAVLFSPYPLSSLLLEASRTALALGLAGGGVALRSQ